MATNSNMVDEWRALWVQWMDLSERLFDIPDEYASLGGAGFLSGLTGHTDITEADVISAVASTTAVKDFIINNFHDDNFHKMRR